MAGKIYIGIAGWSYPDWKGIVYTRRGVDQLEYVISFIDCIKINSTFYSPPTEKNSKFWRKKTAKKPEFFFTAKLNRDFTHEGKIDSDMVQQFHTGFQPMLEESKLRHLLVQFRYDFVDCTENRRLLSQIVKCFCDAFNLAVEVRHKSWQQKEALDFLKNLGVTVCNLDYPTTYNSFDMQHCTVGKNGYFRLHGRNEEKWFSKSTRDETYDYYYSADELDQIKQRVDN